MGAEDFSDELVHRERAAMSVESCWVVEWADLLHEFVGDVSFEVGPVFCWFVENKMQFDSVSFGFQLLTQNNVLFCSVGIQQH